MQPKQPLPPDATQPLVAPSTLSVGPTVPERTISVSSDAFVSPLDPTSPRAPVNLAESSPANCEAIPSQIGRFVILERLGGGGFGTVYLAHDPILDRDVALKVPRGPAGWGAAQTKSFLDEARMAVRLSHPHVIIVHDAGETTDGCVFIAMEYVEGETLSTRLKHGKLGIPEATRICGQIAEAMHAGHKLGMVHRDLKPANVLLDRRGNVKVCDFGLALRDEEQRARRGDTSGTLRYMSPEQLSGNSHLLDGRSDIWSMGVILYECLSGRPPFRGDSREELGEEILTRDPKPLRQIDDTIPQELDELCRLCLQRDVTKRLRTALDFQRALDRDSARLDASPRPRQPLRWVVAAGVLALCGVVGMAARGGFSGSSVSGGSSTVNRLVPDIPGPAPGAPPQGAPKNLAPRKIAAGTLDLLGEVPRDWVFESLDPHSIHTYSGTSRRLTVHSIYWSAFGCTQHPREFKMDVATWHGPRPASVGVFWGGHPEAAADGSTQESCLSLLVQPDAESPTGVSLTCYRLIVVNDIRGMRVFNTTYELARAAISLDWRKPVDIQLQVDQGRCIGGTVQGTPVEFSPEAGKPPTGSGVQVTPVPLSLDQAAVPWEDFATGDCGLISRCAPDAVVFTRALLSSTSKE